jgi:hypothetical protein
MEKNAKITSTNYLEKALVFRDRQAGVSEVFDPISNKFKYNAYCLEKMLLKELFTVEYDFLDDALQRINEEFGSWDLEDFAKSGCGNCAAKK